MHWLTAHVYVALLAIAGFFLLTGAYVLQRSALSESDSTVTWGGAGGLAFLGGGNRAQDERIRTEDLLRAQNKSADYSTLPVFSNFTDGTAPIDMDFESLLDQLSSQAGGLVSEDGDIGETGAYDFIPRGLLSIETQVSNTSPLRRALFDYGNRIGGYIQAFDDLHTNMIPVLKNAYEDRTDAEKVAAAIEIGKDYQTLGRDLLDMQEIPPSVATMHKAIGSAYINAGAKMITKLQAKTDAEFLAAMHSYNASALEFTNNFVALATYFGAAGVQFNKSDPGSIFMFTTVSF